MFIFILELAAGISGYVLRNDTYNLVSNTLQSSMGKYGGNTSNEITYIWDEIQVDVSMKLESDSIQLKFYFVRL